METVLDVRCLKAGFTDIEKNRIDVLRGVDLTIKKNESLGLVGESGSGKTLTARTIMGLLPESMYIKEGEVFLCGEDILKMGKEGLRRIRGSKVSMIFQEPSSYLNPVFTVGNQIFEAIKGRNLSVDEKKRMCMDILKDVALTEDIYYRYPHQLSGGQQQRVMIGMALINRPSLLIADEPTTALDITTASGIIELLKDIREKYGLSILFITHDISLAAGFTDKIAVMYAGMVVEISKATKIISSPLHPYTELLVSCLPERYQYGERIRTIEGSVPDYRYLPSGCAFHPRCPYVMDICRENQPPEIERDGSLVRCFRYGNNI